MGSLNPYQMQKAMFTKSLTNKRLVEDARLQMQWRFGRDYLTSWFRGVGIGWNAYWTQFKEPMVVAHEPTPTPKKAAPQNEVYQRLLTPFPIYITTHYLLGDPTKDIEGAPSVSGRASDGCVSEFDPCDDLCWELEPPTGEDTSSDSSEEATPQASESSEEEEKVPFDTRPIDRNLNYGVPPGLNPLVLYPNWNQEASEATSYKDSDSEKSYQRFEDWGLDFVAGPDQEERRKRDRLRYYAKIASVVRLGKEKASEAPIELYTAARMRDGILPKISAPKVRAAAKALPLVMDKHTSLQSLTIKPMSYNNAELYSALDNRTLHHLTNPWCPGRAPDHGPLGLLHAVLTRQNVPYSLPDSTFEKNLREIQLTLQILLDSPHRVPYRTPIDAVDYIMDHVEGPKQQNYMDSLFKWLLDGRHALMKCLIAKPYEKQLKADDLMTPETSLKTGWSLTPAVLQKPRADGAPITK